MFTSAYRIICRARDRLFTVCCRGGFHRIGERSLLCLPIRLNGEQWIELGHRVHVGPNCWFNVIGRRDYSPVISLGDETSIVGSLTITAVERVVIESRVLMAGNVYISD